MLPKKDPDFTLGGGGVTTSEEVINGRLSDFLAATLPRGISSNPEQRVHNRKVDIVVEKPGAHKIFLEAKLTTLAKAKEHAQQHFVLLPGAMRPTHVGAICYSAAFHRPGAAEAGEPLEFALLDRDSGQWTPAQEFTAAQLAAVLADPVKLRDSEDEIGNAIWAVKDALKKFTAQMAGREAQFAEVLKIELPELVERDPKKHRAYVAARDEAMHIAGLVIVNAMMFSSALNAHSLSANSGGKISPYDGCAPERLKRHWEKIEDEINYVSILAPARRLIAEGACGKSVLSILKQAADRILPLAERGVDILGRVFHTVLAHADTYAAFFTGIPGATLMSEIALDPDRWENVDWRDPESIGALRVCDPACGSGTLIGLAAWKLRRNFRFRVDENRADKLRDLQRRLVQDVIYAADIIPAAAHLAATSVALISPEVSFEKSNVFLAPMGVFGEDPGEGEEDTRIRALGSLGHLAGDKTHLLPKDRLENLGIKPEGGVAEPFPLLDACLMNPPFVGGHQGREMFAFAGKYRDLLREALADLGKKKKFSSGLGQGPAFLTLSADRIRDGGRLALILPATLATGGSSAWRECRKVIEGRFDIEALILSADPVRPAFSDSTNLSEVMLVARKSEKGGNGKARWNHEALFVVLHENHCAPDALGGSRQKALEIGESVNEAITSGSRRGKIECASGVCGSYARMKWRGKSSWNGLNFVDMSLTAEVTEFGEAGMFAGSRVPIVPLIQSTKSRKFGGGRLHKYIREEKRLAIVKNQPGAYPGYYPGHHARVTNTANRHNSALLEKPTVYVMPTPDAEGKNESWARDLYQSAGHVVLNESFRFNTTRRLASLVTKPVQASGFHPVPLKDETDEKRKAMTLWLNSTPVLAHIARTCNRTCGSKVKFPAATLENVPALDFERMDGKIICNLARSFDAFVKDGETLQHFPAMAHDPARARLDDAVADALGIDKTALADLRVRLAREPVISNRPYSEQNENGKAKLIPGPKPARPKPATKSREL